MSIQTPSKTTTGQYHPSNCSDVRHRGTATQLGTTLSYLYPDKDEKLTFANCNISSLLDANKMNLDALTNRDNWSKVLMGDNINDANGASFKTQFSPASLVMDAQLGRRAYYFWVDNNNSGQIYATYYDQSSAWSGCAYKIQNNSGDNRKATDDTYLDAYSYDGKIVLVYCHSNSNKMRLKFRLLDPLDIDDGNQTWKNISGRSLDVDNLTDSYYKISVDWITQGNDGSNQDDAVVSLYSSTHNKLYTFIVELDSSGMPESSGDNYLLDKPYSASRGAMIRRTLAGQLQMIYCDKDNHRLYVRTLDTHSPFSSSTAWGSAETLNDIKKDSDNGPTLIFFQGDAYDSSQDIGDNNPGPFDTSNCPVYRVAFYSDGDSDNNASDLQIQGNYEGTTLMVTDYTVSAPVDASAWSPAMIMEAFPVPNQNITSASANQNLVEVLYGISSESSLSAKVEWQLLFGVKASMETSKGIGPAADFQFKAGPHGSLVGTTTSRTEEAKSVITSAVQGQNGEVVVSNRGAVHAFTLPSLTETAALFSDINNVIPNGVTAPLFSSLAPKSGTSEKMSLSYQLFSATQGDIRSYTEGSINEKMAYLYNSLSSEQKDNLSSGYVSNYIQDVIIPNAYYFGTTPYLSFSVGPIGEGTSQFREADSVETSFGLSVDTELYAGISGGEEFSVFGFGEGFKAELLAGFDFHLNTVATLSNTEGWGIITNFNLPAAVPDAYSYAVHMFICKPSEMWARELEYFGNPTNGAKLQANGALPGKIFFVVPSNTIVER